MFPILGGSRLNMFAYFIFLKYGLVRGGGVNIAVSATTIYFMLKTVFFVTNVIRTGQGF